MAIRKNLAKGTKARTLKDARLKAKTKKAAQQTNVSVSKKKKALILNKRSQP